MKMKDLLGVLGGGLGALYTTGYLVAAGHARILGLPVRSTDPVPLLGAAWEFVVRGTVIVVLRVVESATLGRVAMVAIVASVSLLVGLSPRATAALKRRSRPLVTLAGRHARLLLVLTTLVCVSIQIWHIAAHVIPTSAVTTLLRNRGERSPFQGSSTRGFFEARWHAVQEDLLGNGARTYSRNLSRRYVIHVVVAFATALAAWLLWRQCRDRHEPSWVRAGTAMSLGIAAFLLVYTPLYYGALMKSYQYPLVNLIGADKETSEDLAAELGEALSRPRFLLETTDDDLYLFDSTTQELHIVAKDTIAMIKVIAEDFVFRQ